MLSYLRSAVPCHSIKNIKQNRQLHILGFDARKIIPVAQERFRILKPYTRRKLKTHLEAFVQYLGLTFMFKKRLWSLTLQKKLRKCNSINRALCAFFHFICKFKIFSNKKSQEKIQVLTFSAMRF